MLLYVGPDQIIPLSGFLGTAAGLVLIFWGKVTQAARYMFGTASASRRSKARD